VPLFDYACPECGAVREVLILADTAPPLCVHVHENGRGRDLHKMVRQQSAPAFHVKGFSSRNGYSGGQTYEVKQKDKHTKVVVNT
jgi:hypothetical protein